MAEQWRNISGFGGYEVSDLGRVKSQYRNPCTGTVREIVLRPGANKSGHLFVYLGRGNKRYIHRLVLEAFVGPCPEGGEALHGPDHTPANCALTNLKWGTRQQNVRDMWERGTANLQTRRAACQI